MTETLAKEFSRRTFLRGGGALIVGFGVTAAARVADGGAAALGPGKPTAVDQVDSYLVVHPDNTVTLYHSTLERGQGTKTGLLQIAAEELDIGMHQISQALVDSATVPFTGGTGASEGTPIGGSFVRAAAATARQALLNLASTQLGVPPSILTVSNGVISGDGRTVTYGQLVGGRLFNVSIPEKPNRRGALTLGGEGPLLRVGMEPGDPGTKPISQYGLVTKSVPRVDIPDIVSGKLVYAGDVRLPGMLHGRVVRPRGQSSLANKRSGEVSVTTYSLELSLGGGQAPLSIDESSIKHLQDVQVVRIGNFVGVVAPEEYDAIKAAALLKVRWAEPSSPLPGNGNLPGYLRDTAGETNSFLTDDGSGTVGSLQQGKTALLATWMGDVDLGLVQAAKTVSATYQSGYRAHGPIGPCVAVADVTTYGATLLHQVGPFGFYSAAQVAAAFGLPATSVREIHFQGSSFYGMGAELDGMMAAALMSRAVGKPVRVQLMRWDDHGYDNYDAAQVIDVRAGIDANGNIVAFDWVEYVQQDQLPATSYLTGGSYLVRNRRVVRRMAPWLFAVSVMRAPAERGAAFASEQMIDELAYAARMDPLAFRRQNMPGNEAWLTVLEAVAKASKWQPRVAASMLSGGDVVRGRGFGFGTHAPFGGPQGQPNLDYRVLEPTTPAAAVAEIEVNKKTGKITVMHVYAAAAPGLVVGPNRLSDQIISSVTQGTSQALIEEVTFDKSNVTSLDWVTYPMLRFKDHPKVTPIVIQQLDQLPLGSGEEPLPATFPAIANAFFDATGVRLRQTPMTPAVVRGALQRAARG
jgi:nicotinate dehydrogenase subunit B